MKYIPAWVPGAGFQKIARAYRKSSLFLLNEPFEHVKNQLVRAVCSTVLSNITHDVQAQNGPDALRTSAAKSLIQGMTSESDDMEYTEKIVKSVLATIYGGALWNVYIPTNLGS